jgi:hypothetical protein
MCRSDWERAGDRGSMQRPSLPPREREEVSVGYFACTDEAA